MLARRFLPNDGVGPAPWRDETEINDCDDRGVKRMSVALVVAGLLSVTIPGGAVHAASASESLDSVVQAIKKQFAKKSTVHFSVRRRGGPPPSEGLKISGAHRFNASGMYAADLTEISRETPVHPGRHRAHHQTHLRGRHHRSHERQLGHPSDQKSGDGSDRRGLPGALPIRDRDGKFSVLMKEILAEAGIKTVLTGIRMPQMNSVTERWVQSCRNELLDRCLVWNERHPRHALREYGHFYNQHRAHQALDQAAPLRSAPDPISDPTQIIDLNVRRRDRLGGVLHEYSHVA
ncbi:integrase core domain-containing protein [Nonomuraea sp. NPDC003560]|uniref:integrase core domain-containing protein n=1 Tax=Nonomuraea sp. NPDC003560 TaxID=3364341 RepID=UPI00368F288E